MKPDFYSYWETTTTKKKSEIEMEDANYGVRYVDDEEVEFFKNEKTAKKRVEELLRDNDVEEDSIYMFKIEKMWKAEKPPVEFDLIEV